MSRFDICEKTRITWWSWPILLELWIRSYNFFFSVVSGRVIIAGSPPGCAAVFMWASLLSGQVRRLQRDDVRTGTAGGRPLGGRGPARRPVARPPVNGEGTGRRAGAGRAGRPVMHGEYETWLRGVDRASVDRAYARTMHGGMRM